MLATNEVAGPKFARTSNDLFAIAGPNNHLLCHLFMVATWATGGRVVSSSGSFEAKASLVASGSERATHTAVVPTMVQQIIATRANMDFEPVLSFRNIVLGGSGVSPEVLSMCTRDLGSKSVEIFYGNTEGVLITSGKSPALDLIEDVNVAVGRCKPGCQVKICAPNTIEPMPLKLPGELHFQSISLAEGYLGHVSEEFYHHEGQVWMRSGDQAVMTADGRIFIVGRYKDMIIRGGENISPVAIEACIDRVLPHLRDLQLQVVGAPDDATGELPVALTARRVSARIARDIRQAVVTHMGSMYSLENVMSIEKLGLEQFPRTMAGKIQKVKLRDLLRQRRPNGRRDSHEKKAVLSDLTAQVKATLGRAVGLEGTSLSSDSELQEIGDSISLLRFADRLAKQTGRAVSVQDVAEARTIGDLVQILSSRSPATVAYTWAPDMGGALPMKDLLHVRGDEELFQATRDLVRIVIQPHGLTWDDVREVFPVYDFTEVQVRNGAFERWSIKVAIVARGHGVAALHRAMIAALKNNPMQSSFVVHDRSLLNGDIALHVLVDQNEGFLETRIERGGLLKNVSALQEQVLGDDKHTKLPGPLVHASLFELEAESCGALLLNLHHAVTDASFLQLLCEDIDVALNEKPARPHVPYKLYCESLYALRESSEARIAVAYHVGKLQRISQHRTQIWPSLKMQCLPEDGGPDGVVEVFSAYAVLALCRKHSELSPSLVLKAATALFLLYKSGRSHALFAHVEAARDSIPFMPPSLAKAARLEASNISGQLFQSVLNVVSLDEHESVLQFLFRMQEEQQMQHKYCAAPWKKIMRPLEADDAAFFPQIAAWCMFNWLGTDYVGGNSFEDLEIVSAALRRVIVPFVNNCALRRAESGDQIMLHLRGAVFEREDLKVCADEIHAIVRWLAKEEHSGLPVTSFREAFR